MRIFINGSCVSRDLLPLIADRGAELAFYSPRQSLIPLLGAIPGLHRYLDTTRLTSRFQRRAVEGTLNADFADQMERHRATSDMVLWDITDERLGVFEHKSTYVTRSLELISSGLDALLSTSARHIPFGSDEHFDLWSLALRRWGEKLKRLGLDDRVVLLAPAWARQFEDGTRTPQSYGIEAGEFEILAKDYYAQAKHVIPSLRIIGRGVPTLAAAHHQWGRAPFHFADKTNRALAGEIVEVGFNPSSEFPPPQPTVIQTKDAEFFIHSSRTWADEFALYVANKGGVVQRFPYQASPEFRVTLDRPGIYRFRMFHKKGQLKSVVYSEPTRVVSDRV